jgi:hypothetical protein
LFIVERVYFANCLHQAPRWLSCKNGPIIKHILKQKGGRTVTVPPETRIGVAAHRLRAEGIGALVMHDYIAARR